MIQVYEEGAMGFLGGVAGPGREEVWRQLSAKIGGEYIAGSVWRAARVRARVKDWTATLDTFHSHRTHWARVRVPFVSLDGFRFRIFRTNPFFEFRKRLGYPDITVGHSATFDDQFIIHGNDEPKVRTLFANATIRQLILAQPNHVLRIQDGEGLFRAFPKEADELCFVTQGKVGNVERLQQTLELFAEVLGELHRMGSVSTADPGVTL